MGLLDVINVGQGDCFIVNPTDNCAFSNNQIIIDLGNGSIDISQFINKKTNIFLTHHHNDHIGGFKFFIGEKFKLIDKIFVPAYQNEITLIAKSILNLKGIKKLYDCSDFIDELKELISNQLMLKNISGKSNDKIIFVYEGMRLCKHIEVLNPPLKYKTNVNWSEQLSKDIFRELSDNLFEHKHAGDIQRYFNAIIPGNRHFFDDIFNIDSPNITDLFLMTSNNEYDISNGANYYLDFIFKNINHLMTFNEHPNKQNLSIVYENFVKHVHDVCIMLRINFNGVQFLLTGDSSKNVFNRLINDKKCIKAKYLKMPHHGSINNIDENIISKINPEYAIICHNNRKFGNSEDSHPNQEVIDILKRNGIKILTTNNIVKDDKIIHHKQKTSGILINEDEISFIDCDY